MGPRTGCAVIMVALVGLACCLGTRDTVGQQSSLGQQLVGSWILVSNSAKHPDGATTEQFGPDPNGILIYAADGHFALVNTRAVLPKLASNRLGRGTPEENKAIVEGSLAYYGTYTVDDATKIISVRIAGSTYPNQIGTTQKRLITSLSADELAFTNPAATSGGSIQLVWKRAK